MGKYTNVGVTHQTDIHKPTEHKMTEHKALPSHLQQLENIYKELKAQTDGDSSHIDRKMKNKLQSIFHAIGAFKETNV